MYPQFSEQFPDVDPEETAEWLESMDAVLHHAGPERARYLLYRLMTHARRKDVGVPPLTQSAYVNSIPPHEEPAFPGDEELERRIRRLIRWNAMAMVTRGNHRFPGLGGHISTYASSASIYEVGFNHFFRGKDARPGDQIFYQGHAAPGIYARAYLEGRLDEGHLDHFRREVVPGQGLSSYPHPRLMPEFWEFPTVSMGLGPITAIYQARFNRYLAARGVADTSSTRVWAFLGDGECDEPEALAGLGIAAREKLDNLVFLVNCNLQRLDGPVRGNGKIIQELEGVFRGAGWNVIKVIWAREWDDLLANDVDGLLAQKMMDTLDGEYQKLAVESGAFIREKFFGPDPVLRAMVDHLSDDDLEKLRRGGHDYRKIYAAMKTASTHRGSPTAILFKTIKGWTLGEGFEARNMTHQMKKLGKKELMVFRDRLQLPIPDAHLAETPPYFSPGIKSEEVEYMLERRRVLGGCLPKRIVRPRPITVPGAEVFAEFAQGSKGQEVSTTMATVRLLRGLLRAKDFGMRVVPIVPDEARTFGMEGLIKEFAIYTPFGQRYEPVDAALLLSYEESARGQILEEGITEAGSMASFNAAATAYSTHGEPTIPFYLFYSMFGFQRTMDQIWAAADARARGFMMGATAGRTTLNGEGLQHADGHSHLLASAVPSVRPYDPAFAYEIAVIVKDGLRRMLEARRRRDLLHHDLQRELRDAADGAGLRARNPRRALSIQGGVVRTSPSRADSRFGADPALRAASAGDSRDPLRRRRRRVERHQLHPLATGSAGVRAIESRAIGRRRARAAGDAPARADQRTDRRGLGLGPLRSRSDRAVDSAPDAFSGNGRLRAKRHAATRCGASSASTQRPSCTRCCSSSREKGAFPRRCPKRPDATSVWTERGFPRPLRSPRRCRSGTDAARVLPLGRIRSARWLRPAAHS